MNEQLQSALSEIISRTIGRGQMMRKTDGRSYNPNTAIANGKRVPIRIVNGVRVFLTPAPEFKPAPLSPRWGAPVYEVVK